TISSPGTIPATSSGSLPCAADSGNVRGIARFASNPKTTVLLVRFALTIVIEAPNSGPIAFDRHASLTRRIWQKSSANQSIPNNAVERTEEIGQADLFALVVAAGRVTNRDLEQPVLAAGDAGGDFGLKSEARLLDFETFDYVAAKCLVARLHVGDLESGRPVR